MVLCSRIIEPTINKANIWVDDVLDRKSVADKFTNLLKSIQHSFVISVNASYGTGKSFFLRRWCETLDEDFVWLFYNAWQTDFHEHAFIPFVHSLICEMRQKKHIDENDSLFQKFQEVSEKIISSFAINWTSKVLGELGSSEDVKGALGSLKNFEEKSYFEAYQERKALLEEFKEILVELVQELRTKKAQKLVIFIDELERCRPTYAVELLESIKHLFDVEGIIFVIGIDREQLKHTISNLYGIGMDSDGYLRRFIDLELSLPDPKDEKYIKYLYKSYGLDKMLEERDGLYNGGASLIKYMTISARLFSLSLREIAQCFTEMNIVIRTLGGKKFFPPVLSILVGFKCRQKPLYDKLGMVSLGAIIQDINELVDKSVLKENEKEDILAFIYFALDNQEDNYLKNNLNEVESNLQVLISTASKNKELEKRKRILDKAYLYFKDIINQCIVDRDSRLINLLKENLAFC